MYIGRRSCNNRHPPPSWQAKRDTAHRLHARPLRAARPGLHPVPRALSRHVGAAPHRSRQLPPLPLNVLPLSSSTTATTASTPTPIRIHSSQHSSPVRPSRPAAATFQTRLTRQASVGPNKSLQSLMLFPCRVSQIAKCITTQVPLSAPMDRPVCSSRVQTATPPAAPVLPSRNPSMPVVASYAGESYRSLSPLAACCPISSVMMLLGPALSCCYCAALLLSSSCPASASRARRLAGCPPDRIPAITHF